MTTSAYSAQVFQVKNNKVLILLENEKISVNDEISLFDANNTLQGKIKIQQVRRQRAIGELTEGNALVGYNARNLEQQKYFQYSKIKLSFGLKTAQNGLSVLQKSSVADEIVEMNGTNFGLIATGSYLLTDSILAKLLVGLEQYSISGTSKLNLCGNSTTANCFTKSNYIFSSARIEYVYRDFYLNTGATVKYGINNESNSIFSEDISIKGNLDLEIGKYFIINERSFIPTSIGYEHSLNTSSDVPQISQFNLFIGYGFNF